jgi:hypothetical protein
MIDIFALVCPYQVKTTLLKETTPFSLRHKESKMSNPHSCITDGGQTIQIPHHVLASMPEASASRN